MNLFSALSIASDIASIASGNIPIESIIRHAPSFFHRRKGMTKAQIKKMMMRKRRAFVDNVVMMHERRNQKKNFEDRINAVKAEIIKKKEREEAEKIPVKKISRSGPSHSPSPKTLKRSGRGYKDKYGNWWYDGAEDEDWKNDEEQNPEQKHLTAIQLIIAEKQEHKDEDWRGRTNKKRNSGSESSR